MASVVRDKMATASGKIRADDDTVYDLTAFYKALAAYTQGLAIVGKSVAISGVVTRPADTTAYAVADVLSDSASSPTILTFAAVARTNGALGYVLGGTMVTSTAAATAAMVRLLLFNTAPTAVNDNAALSLTDAHALLCIGWLTFDVWQTTANNRIYMARLEGQAPQFDCAAASDDIYAIPVLQNAYTPGSEEIFTFALHVSQD